MPLLSRWLSDSLRDRVNHYLLLALPTGFTVTQIPQLINVHGLFVWACTVLGALGLITVGTLHAHEASSCARCVELWPRHQARLDKLGPRRGWLRMRWQHRQVWMGYGVSVAATVGGVPLAWLTESHTTAVAHTALTCAGFYWGAAWWIHHMQFRAICPWCIKRSALRGLQKEYRETRDEIGRRLIGSPPAEPAEEEAADPEPETTEPERVRPRRRWLRPVAPSPT